MGVGGGGGVEGGGGRGWGGGGANKRIGLIAPIRLTPRPAPVYFIDYTLNPFSAKVFVRSVLC